MLHPKTIRRHLQALRAQCIDNNPDPILRRVAYAMEIAVRRETDSRLGWPSLVDEAQIIAKLLREELAPLMADRVLHPRKAG